MGRIQRQVLDVNNLTFIYEDRSYLLPFCSAIQCEVSAESRWSWTYYNPVWSCMNESCQGALIAVCVVCAILALATTVCNSTVLFVILSNKKLMNAQVVYRMSLAFSDLLVGIFVFPSFIITNLKSVQSPANLHQFSYTGYFEIINGEKVTTTVDDAYIIPFVFTLIDITEEDQRLYNLFGVLGVFSVGVSILTLVTAAIDRFKAVYRPLAYNKSTAQTDARNISIVIWLAMAVFSTFPLYVPKYYYGLLYPMLIIPFGPEAPIIYTLVLAIPVVLMWVATIATFVIYKITTKKRQQLMVSRSHNREIQQQMRLLFTLGIMVGVFTLCLVPVIVLSMLQSLPSLYDIHSVYNSARLIAGIIFTSNSLWNFFIYSGRNKDFRQSAKYLYLKVLFCNKCFQTERKRLLKN